MIVSNLALATVSYSSSLQIEQCGCGILVNNINMIDVVKSTKSESESSGSDSESKLTGLESESTGLVSIRVRVHGVRVRVRVRRLSIKSLWSTSIIAKNLAFTV